MVKGLASLYKSVCCGIRSGFSSLIIVRNASKHQNLTHINAKNMFVFALQNYRKPSPLSTTLCLRRPWTTGFFSWMRIRTACTWAARTMYSRWTSITSARPRWRWESSQNPTISTWNAAEQFCSCRNQWWPHFFFLISFDKWEGCSLVKQCWLLRRQIEHNWHELWKFIFPFPTKAGKT